MRYFKIAASGLLLMNTLQNKNKNQVGGMLYHGTEMFAMGQLDTELQIQIKKSGRSNRYKGFWYH